MVNHNKYSRYRKKKNIVGGTKKKKINWVNAQDVKDEYEVKYKEGLVDKDFSCKKNPPDYDISERVEWNRGRVLRDVDLSKYRKMCYTVKPPDSNRAWKKCKSSPAPPFKKKPGKSKGNNNMLFPVTKSCSKCIPYYQYKDNRRDILDSKSVYMIDKSKKWTSPDDGGVWKRVDFDYFTAKEIMFTLLDMLSFTADFNLSNWISNKSNLQHLWNSPVPGKVTGYFVPTLGQISLFTLDDRLLTDYNNIEKWKNKGSVKIKDGKGGNDIQIIRKNIKSVEKKYSKGDKGIKDFLIGFKKHVNSLDETVSNIIARRDGPCGNISVGVIQQYISKMLNIHNSELLKTIKRCKKSEYKEITRKLSLLNSCGDIDSLQNRLQKINYINPDLWFNLFNEWQLFTNIKEGDDQNKPLEKAERDFIYNLQIIQKIRTSVSRSNKDQHGLTVSQEFMLYLQAACNYLALLHVNHQNFKNLIKISVLLNPHELLIGLVQLDVDKEKYKKEIIRSKKKFFQELTKPFWFDESHSVFISPYPTFV